MAKKERKYPVIDKYIRSLAIKDDNGNVISDGLENNHDALLNLYQQKFFLDLKTDGERLIAKQYFKDQLPYKEWRDEISKTPFMLATEMEDFEERYNPSYYRKRKTPRGRNAPKI